MQSGQFQFQESWGSTIAKIIGSNVVNSEEFDHTVRMWVLEEIIGERKLTEIINTEHENPKYLPGHKLPHNVARRQQKVKILKGGVDFLEELYVQYTWYLKQAWEGEFLLALELAVADLLETVTGADILVFVVPHQFIRNICKQLKDHLTPTTIGVSLIKGIDEGPSGLKLISDIIREELSIDMSVLMGANIASEVADGKFCETTIGSKNKQNGMLLKNLMQTPNFRIAVVEDADTVEICGALKNIVAVGAGFCDGMGYGDNTKAAVIRLGLMEMIAFAKLFCRGAVQSATFLESCGVADLITTCYGGRNRRVAEAFARSGKSIEELEKELLNGQKLQGPQTAAELYRILQTQNSIDKFPLFMGVYQVCYEGKPVHDFIACLQSHPEHL
uniref:Glycerol-3-phosphate dehydrogenase [NAD(+)] n=1 Tax=Eptatretus burgeri TaxID=7764 RepID=A0A8C4QAZ4_EPTBU